MKLGITDDRPRVAIVVTAGQTASIFVLNFAKYVAMQGYEVTILADGIERFSQKIGEGKLSQVPVAMERNPHLVRDLRSLILLTREIKKINPHVLTYATPKASLLTSIVGFMLRVPIRVYQVWGLRLETVHGPGRMILAGFEKITSFFSTKVLANSPSLANKYREFKLNVGRPVDTLGRGSSHGVDLKWFSKDSSFPSLDDETTTFLNNEPESLVVGFVGRLHKDKGIDTLLDAIRELHTAGYALRLMLVGGDEGAKLDLSGGLEEITLLVGRVGDTRPYYASMDVLVLPSRREGFPNVVLEASAMAIPAIVSDGTGVVDSVINGVTGLIVPVNDATSLAQAILSFAVERDLKVKYGDASRSNVEMFFDQEKIWRKTLHYLIK